MKTYKDYIKEASYDDEVRNTKANRLYPEYLNLYGEIKRFFRRRRLFTNCLLTYSRLCDTIKTLNEREVMKNENRT